jgi:hypothetical protein
MTTVHGPGRADPDRERLRYSEVAECSFDTAPAPERVTRGAEVTPGPPGSPGVGDRSLGDVAEPTEFTARTLKEHLVPRWRLFTVAPLPVIYHELTGIDDPQRRPRSGKRRHRVPHFRR